MRFKITCEITEGDRFPQDYRRKILMLLKTGLREYENVFENFFGTNAKKKYAWSVYFPNSSFTKDEIILNGEEKKFIINFSVLENSDSVNIYNAFTHIRFKELKINDMTKVRITNITVVPTEQTVGNSLIAKTMSPIVCRDHSQETSKDTYYTGNDEKFTEIIKRNLYFQMEEEYGEYIKKDIEELIIGTKGLKKIVVKFYNKTIDTSVGIILLEGKKYLLDYIYNAGFGSITGSGFGLLEKIN